MNAGAHVRVGGRRAVVVMPKPPDKVLGTMLVRFLDGDRERRVVCPAVHDVEEERDAA